jgi:type VI secretion system VasD/TssJ family lipoprotein
MFAKLATRLAVLATALALAACGGPPPPTTVALAISGAPNMNGSAPAKVQVLYLASAAKFQTADYYALAQNPAAALGADLVAADEYLVSPGGAAKDQKSFTAPVTHVGFVVGFRDIGTAAWRAIVPVKPNAANTVTAKVEAASVAAAAN